MSKPPPPPSTVGLRGDARVPGDKSISHRALILAALCIGESRIDGLGDGDDIHRTIAALRALGASLDRAGSGWAVAGVGLGGLLAPAAPLDMGNSGTSARLLMGLVAAHPIQACFTGDASLSRRPMERVAAPLRRLGARIETAGDGLPLIVGGARAPLPLHHRFDVASAQLKSAILLAALNTPGVTTIEAPSTRDHLERLLARFGAQIEVDDEKIRLTGQPELHPQRLQVPGDFSAAAFLVAATLIVPGSDVRFNGINLNPRRTGLLRVLERMGADITLVASGEQDGEPIGDLRVRHSALEACQIPAEDAADMIDEFPILFVLAAFARGVTRAAGLAELRLKESDRLAAMAAALSAAGVPVALRADGLSVTGSGGAPIRGGATVDPRQDHRVAMSMAVAGLRAREPIGVADMSSAATSFPGFLAALHGLRAA